MALAQARTNRGQARVAGRLARAHQAASDALRPLAGSPALSDALETVTAAYADLERAAIAGSPSRFGAARASVGAAEARLARAVPATALRRAPVPRIEPVPANTSRAIGVIALLLGLIALGLAVTRGRRPPTPAAARDAVPPPSGWLAVDPVGRWDARP